MWFAKNSDCGFVSEDPNAVANLQSSQVYLRYSLSPALKILEATGTQPGSGVQGAEYLVHLRRLTNRIGVPCSRVVTLGQWTEEDEERFSDEDDEWWTDTFRHLSNSVSFLRKPIATSSLDQIDLS